jgi:hypothetical protein
MLRKLRSVSLTTNVPHSGDLKEASKGASSRWAIYDRDAPVNSYLVFGGQGMRPV